MTEAQAIEAILQFWQDGWEQLHPDIPTDPDYVPWTTDNEPFASLKTWVRITVVPTANAQASMGGLRRWARKGQIAVQIFTDVNSGDAPRAQLADDVRTVLEGKRIAAQGVDEPVCVYAGSTEGKTVEGAWNTSVVILPFAYYHQH